MNTFLSAAQLGLQAAFRSFAAEVLAPAADKLRRREIDLKEFLGEFGKRGYLGLPVPRELGGNRGTLLDALLLAEELGHFEPGLGLTLGNHFACMLTIRRLCDEATQARLLPALSSGGKLGTLAFNEQGAGTDLSAVQTKTADKVSGTKTGVVSGDIAQVILVLGRQDESGTPALVACEDRAGVKCTSTRNLMGLQSAHVADIELRDVTPAVVMAHGERAMDAAMEAMAIAKLFLSGCALGMIEAATEAAVSHANNRQQFGAPIGTFQGVQWKLADMAVDAAGARLQVYRAAWSYDQDLQNFLRNASMASLLATRAARQHCGEAIQILGANGIMEEQPLAHFYDDAKVAEVAGGTSEFQKMLITRQLHI